MTRDQVAAGIGVSLLVIALGLAVTDRPLASLSLVYGVILLGIVLVGTLSALWKVRGTLDDPSNGAVAWAPTDPFATPSPERSANDAPLSSVAFAEVVQSAGSHARHVGSVDAGITVIREPLRTALREALLAGGASRDTIITHIDEGTWTDDPIAAAVVSPQVDPPTLSLRRRLEAWLFPERVVRRHARRTMAAIAETTAESLPTVTGQTAPRTVPVIQPSLAMLQRDTDGSLQPAQDPTALTRDPTPLAPSTPPRENDGQREEQGQ